MIRTRSRSVGQNEQSGKELKAGTRKDEVFLLLVVPKANTYWER
jgi:hypothetical protein